MAALATWGTLSPETVVGMQRAGVTPQTALISMRDEQLVPLVKAAPAEPEVDDALARLTLADLRQLPQALAQPQAVSPGCIIQCSGLRVRLWPTRRLVSLIVNYPAGQLAQQCRPVRQRGQRRAARAAVGQRTFGSGGGWTMSGARIELEFDSQQVTQALSAAAATLRDPPDPRRPDRTVAAHSAGALPCPAGS